MLKERDRERERARIDREADTHALTHSPHSITHRRLPDTHQSANGFLGCCQDTLSLRVTVLTTAHAALSEIERARTHTSV